MQGSEAVAHWTHSKSILKSRIMPNYFRSAGTFEGPLKLLASRGVTRGKLMKMLLSVFALAMTLAFAGPAFAQDAAAATDKASCDKAGGTWDDAAKKCNPKQ